MDANEALRFGSREELREWLETHYASEPCCWAICKRGKPPADGELWSVDVVEEALCFGWTDSVFKRISSGENAQNIMPRKSKAHWTELNKARCRRLEQLGLMTDAGRAVMPDLNEPFQIDDDILEALESDELAWENFQTFPELYQRVSVDNIQGYRRSAADRTRLVNKLVRASHDGIMYGQWNDYGRLVG